MHFSSDHVVLMCDQHQYKHIIPLEVKPINIGTFYYKEFCAFVECFHARPCLNEYVLRIVDTPEHCCQREVEHEVFAQQNLLHNYQEGREKQQETISDNITIKSSNFNIQGNISANSPFPLHPLSKHTWGKCSKFKSSNPVHQGPLTFDLLPNKDELDHHWTSADTQAKLLRWHHCLGHISFKTLDVLSELGDIPKSLAKIPRHKCAGCMFGAMTKKSCRTIGATNVTLFEKQTDLENVSLSLNHLAGKSNTSYLKKKLVFFSYSAKTRLKTQSDPI